MKPKGNQISDYIVKNFVQHTEYVNTPTGKTSKDHQDRPKVGQLSP